jgi:formate dehydrogenase iron-sulfur subunit
MSKGMLIDITACTGCRACVTACRTKNRLDAPPGARLSETDFTVLEHRDKLAVRRMCYHCNDPACVSVCPVAAMVKTPEGPVVYDRHRCMGCRYCMVACPHGVPTFEWHERMPSIRKCSFCPDHVAAGRPPPCATACPTEATLFGDRDSLIKAATARIDARPERYSPGIWGRDVAGGTSVMFLSPVPFDRLGLRTDLGPDPLGRATGRILALVPGTAATVVTVLGGTYWLYRRREAVAAEETLATARDGATAAARDGRGGGR